MIQRISQRFSIALLALVIVLFGTSAFAQFDASLSGTVEDNSGAVISGATVTLTNNATQQVKTVTSGGSGAYRFNELAPGTYSVTATAPNFKAATFNTVNISAETPRGLDIKLELGAVTQSVVVNADETPVLQTADASIGTTISSEDVTRLPIFGRDPYELLRTAVGITGDGSRGGNGGAVALPNLQGPGQSNFGVFQTENQVQISAAGQRVTSNSYLIDGVSVDSLEHGGSAIITPNPEAVSQISVATADYDATDGRNVGAQIKTVTRGGTNDIHGSLFFQYDEPGLNAYESYGGPEPGSVPERVQNKQREYAASIGGPIIKNKLFIFGSYEGGTNSNSSFASEYVPTPQFISSLAANRAGGIVAGTLSGPGGAARVLSLLTPVCSDVQPAGAPCQVVNNALDVGSLSGSLGTFVPPPGAGGVAVPPNWFIGNGLDGVPDIEFAQITVPSRFRGNQFNGRIDWNATAHDQVAFSIFTSKLAQTEGDAGTGAEPLADLPFKPFNSSGTLLYIHSFGASTVNEARGNYTRFADNQIKDSAGVVDFGIPRFEVQNYNFGRLYAGAQASPDTPAIFAENTYEFRDTLIHVFGSHTIRVGGQFRFEQDNDNLSGLARPDYVFQGIWNWANDAPIFEQIAANPNTGGVGDAQRYFRDHDFSGFVQHDWKVMPNLTLNMGLRYEYFEPLHNKTFETNNLVFGPAGNELTQASFAPVNHLYSSNNKNFGPKLGFAYSPTRFNDKLVVRGGFGISYDRIDDILFGNSYENGPNYFQYGLCCGITSTAGSGIVFEKGSSDSPFSYAPNPNLATGVNPVTGTPNAFGGYTPEIETYSAANHTPQPVLDTFSLGVQYELPYQMALGIGYQGSVGHHFPRLVNQNFLYATATGTCLTGNCTVGVNQTPFFAAYIPTTDVYSNYNGLNINLNKRYAHGFDVNATYTYSKSMDQLSNEGPGAQSNQTDPADLKTEYGPSDFDVRHRLTVDGAWDLGKHGSGIFQPVLSGWQVNGIFTYHTGFPWTPVTGVPSVAVVTSAATIAPTRPTAYSGGAGNSCSNSTYINGSNFPNGGPSYFTTGTPGPPGIGRNSFNGPCYFDTDMSAAKQFTFNVLGRETGLKFQANAFNIFNKQNLQPLSFGSPETTIENSLFGKSPEADAGRTIEFFARLQF